MKFDTLRGIWKETTKNIPDIPTDELPDEEEWPENFPDPPAPPELYGRCVLSIRMDSEEDYQRWKKYNPDKKWDFIVSFPAVMRAEYTFKNTMEVEIMAKKVVQLLQMGFDVHTANWKLDEKS